VNFSSETVYADIEGVVREDASLVPARPREYEHRVTGGELLRPGSPSASATSGRSTGMSPTNVEMLVNLRMEKEQIWLLFACKQRIVPARAASARRLGQGCVPDE
jgi:hypothetical protein